MIRVSALLAFVASLALGLSALCAPSAFAGPPTDQLRQRVDRVLSTLEEQRDPARRREAVRGVADEIFAFEETAKRALGRHWTQRTPAEQKEFTGLFSDLLEQAYLSKIGQYSGERVNWTGESIEGDAAIVRTKIVTPQGSEIPVEYRMLREGDRWRVYDVVIEGVSLVSNYRTQFNRIIETGSYNDLVSRLRSKSVPAPASPGGRRS